MTALSALLNNAKGDRSTDDLVEIARKQGHEIHRSVIFKALKGLHAEEPEESTIQALAAAFGLDVREVRLAAGMPPGEQGPWEPPSESARLSRDQRRALEQLIKSIVSAAPTGGVTGELAEEDPMAAAHEVRAKRKQRSRQAPPSQSGTGA